MDVPQRPGPLVSGEPGVLASIQDEDCNLAIWERDALPGMDRLLEGRPGDIRFTAILSDLPDAFEAALDDNGFAKVDPRDAFVDDVCDLAAFYCEIMSLDRLELRLEIVTTDSCRKFHADYVRARLITTYVGAGTDWIEGDDASRVREGSQPRSIRSLRTGDVGLFKGKLATHHPAIHRSPPIGASGGKRLLLVLNPPEDDC